MGGTCGASEPGEENKVVCGDELFAIRRWFGRGHPTGIPEFEQRIAAAEWLWRILDLRPDSLVKQGAGKCGGISTLVLL